MARGVAGTGASTGAGTVASERVEIVTRVERRRSYSAEEKVRLVAEKLRPGKTVRTVSRRHGICTSLLHRWRRAARAEVPSRRTARPQLLPVRLVVPDAAPAQPKRASTARTELSAATSPSTQSGSSVVCWRSAPPTKRFIQIHPAQARRRLPSRTIFKQPRPKPVVPRTYDVGGPHLMGQITCADVAS
ncbi:transposase [Falsiroseomonas sp. HW251]|uniref:transposase n=1 Tax=Falsiroseomonas sp. HW251 TaxID=3390998 RepID=UPI003D31B898